MKKFLSLLLVLAMVLISFGCSSEETREYANGQLVIYTPNSDNEIDIIITAFSETYDVEVIVVQMDTGDCIQAIIDDSQEYSADLLWGGMDYDLYMSYPNLWEVYISNNNQNIEDESLRNTTGYYTNYGVSVNTILLVNTDLLSTYGFSLYDIQGYQDIIDNSEALTGLVALGDPNKSTSAWDQLKSILYLFGSGEDNDWENRDYSNSWEYVQQLTEVIDDGILDNSADVYNLVSSGEYLVGLTNEAACVGLLENEATNIAIVYPEEGVSYSTMAASIVKDASNLDNAKTFIDFLISDEGQSLLAEAGVRPINNSLDNHSVYLTSLANVDNVFVEDEEYTANQRDTWLEQWNSIIAQ